MAKLSNINGKFAVEDTGAIRFSDQTGTTGQILKSNGNSAPTWVDPNTVGTGPWLPLAGGIVSGATTFQSSLTVGGTLTANQVLINSGEKLSWGTQGAVSIEGSTGSNQMEFRTNSTDVMIIDSSGNVGVGTASPVAPLQIEKASNTTLALSNSGSVTSGTRGEIAVYNSSISTCAAIKAVVDTSGTADNVGTDLTFFTRAIGGSLTQKMVINGSGNVIIGNTAVDNPNSLTKVLEIENGGTVGVILNDSRDAPMGLENRGAVFHLTYNTNSRLVVNGASGNVGIGTTSPSEILHLNAPGTGCFIRFQNTGGSGVYIGGRSEVMEMYTNGSEKMRITSGGNVGIGTTAPTAKLQVEMNASSSFHSFFQNNNVSGYGAGFQSYSGVQVYFYDTGGNIGSITSNGSNTAYNTSGSDERLKENIEVWDENVLDKFKNLQPKTFKFIKHKQNNKTVKGYIAQNEVDNFPEAYPMIYDIDAKEDMYQFNPSGMTVYLMKAIQELKAEIEILKNK